MPQIAVQRALFDDELRRASRYMRFKAMLQPYRVDAMVNNLQRVIVLEHLPAGVGANDPNDAFLLPTAVASEAEYRVTGDPMQGSCSAAAGAEQALPRRPFSAPRRFDTSCLSAT